MPNKPLKLMTQFENALADLIEVYMRDGLSPDAVKLVLKTRAEDDYRSFGVGLEFPDRAKPA